MNFIYRKATKEEIERYEIYSQQYGKSTVKKMVSNKQEFVKAISSIFKYCIMMNGYILLMIYHTRKT